MADVAVGEIADEVDRHGIVCLRDAVPAEWLYAVRAHGESRFCAAGRGSAFVVGAFVVGAFVVGAFVVGAFVVGAFVVGAFVVGAFVVGEGDEPNTPAHAFATAPQVVALLQGLARARRRAMHRYRREPTKHTVDLRPGNAYVFWGCMRAIGSGS